ncbi:TonB-dependent receptor [Novosphingobium malaysiense]|uniref:TonB-dependent receptor n=1 Tax=Novosphingobium malaysiense TaxID=1348853 RepID=A0A0B1ZVL1_9SPHN|nr:TonB-dependent receptor [Novosphingobium malaysiense]KHK93177.1 TonB-dependent receptor [Novosphingobium malaysiense]
MSRISAFTTSSIFGLVGLAVALPAPAMAQDDPATDSENAPIIVTAQRREEKQIDVPITITAIGQDQLKTANIRNLADISKVTPGLRFDNASAFFQPTIRGVGTPVTTSGGGSNVGIYIDGFYSPNPLAADFQLMNVQSIQVLKGPQGTLFGRNTTGGAILVQTADPSTVTAVETKVTVSRFNQVKAQGYATVGLTDDIAVDVEGQYSRGDGWKTNIVTGQEVGDYRNWSVRTGIKAQLSSDVSVLLRYQHNHTNDPNPALVSSYRDPVFGEGQPYYAGPGETTYDPDEIASAYPIFIHNTSDVVQGTIKADLGFADLASYSQYRRERVDSSISLDYNGTPFLALGLPNKNSTWSQEFLLNSKPGGRLQWTTGLFAFSNKDIYVTYIDNFYPTRVRLGGNGTTTQTFAGYIDATYELAPNLFLTGGVRYSHDRVVNAYWNTRYLAPAYTMADGTVVPAPDGIVDVPDISSNHWTPRAVIRYKPDDQSSIYASYTKGYKAEIIDVGGSCENPTGNLFTGPFECNPIKPEKIDAYEVGYKFDNRVVSLDLSAFYYDYRNLQVSLYLQGGQASIINAAKAKIYGIDGQLSVRVTERLRVTAAGAWTHARYTEFNHAPVFTTCNPAAAGLTLADYAPTGVCGNGAAFYLQGTAIGQEPVTLRHTRMQRAPDFTGNAGIHYTADAGGGTLQLSGIAAYSSKVYFGPSGSQFYQKAYATLALRAQWTDETDRFTVAVFGDNVTDKRYKTTVQSGGNGVGANWNEPATYGIEFGYRY